MYFKGSELLNFKDFKGSELLIGVSTTLTP